MQLAQGCDDALDLCQTGHPHVADQKLLYIRLSLYPSPTFSTNSTRESASPDSQVGYPDQVPTAKLMWESKRKLSNMRNPGFRAVFAIVTALLMASTPVQAGPVVFSDVIQALGNLQNPPELRLSSAWKYDGRIGSITGTQQSSEPLKRLGARSIEIPARSNSTSANGVPGSLLAGLAIIPNWQQPTTEQINSSSVQGTVCDCGEIIIAGGGFPKWPLLFLAAIPLFFIHHGDHIETPAPTPTPTPPVTAPVPEPASLLLLGTGLAAFGVYLRRRKVKNSVTKNQTT
jgi:PEP-CTERM motif